MQVPDLNFDLNLSSLVDSYFMENTDEIKMKCSTCCPHPSHCPLTGICRQRPAISQTFMTRSPKFLIVQLQRFSGHNSPKIQTIVIPEPSLILPNHDKYDLFATLDHVGPTSRSGHYVSNINTDGHWILCNDTRLSNVEESCTRTEKKV